MATIKIALIQDNVVIDGYMYRIDTVLVIEETQGLALIAANIAVLYTDPPLPDEEDCECHIRLHSMIDPLDHDHADVADYDKLVATNPSTGAIEFIDKPDSLAIGDWIDDITFDYPDIVAGTVQTYVLDPKASFAYTITSCVLESDGTLDNVSININGSPIGGMSALDVSSITETNATSANSVSVTDRVTLVTTATYSGSPTLILGKLKIQRV